MFRRVPYERFAFDGSGRRVEQTTLPRLMAAMLRGLDVRPGMRVLEIGTGSGYNAALLQELVGPDGRVTTVELVPRVSKAAGRRLIACGYPNVELVIGNGADGAPTAAPFDRIIATCKPPEIPDAWVSQLEDGGVLAVPLDLRAIPEATVAAYFVKESSARLRGRGLDRAGFIPMASDPQSLVAEPWRRSDLTLYTEPAIEQPGLWLFVRGTERRAATAVGLLRLLLDRSRVEPLPTPCREPWSFWIFVATSGEVGLVAVRTTGGADLPPSGFGVYDGTRCIAHFEGFGSEVQHGFRIFGMEDSGGESDARERLLQHYEAWADLGFPSAGTLRIDAARTLEGRWELDYGYEARSHA